MDNTKPIDKEKQKYRRKHSHLYLGGFYFFCGFFLLLNNYITLHNKTIISILFVAGMYLIILTILNQIRKFYYVVGLVLFSSFISMMITTYGKASLLWPSIMIIVSLGLLFYGIYFKREKHLKYTVPALVLLGMGVLVGFVIWKGAVSFSFIFRLWPLLLIFFAGYQIYLKQKIGKIYSELEKKEQNTPEKATK